ncbi:hypothetical protein COV53_04900 [Candidatus Gottesmanbacteria bacterium CG11_big_fil_rev_8_21_14_0_20_37_11]|uniref:O-antigen ligase-related domain-containing protein n=2 Tax=Candidatus Gottesmaniibacteriota TaxID=1752720 RepID=A0A2M7RTD5_9BACT|nr:MAG: hypothetical protein COX23_03120 [Candidatus Gottesmanbacteria bacterium CG23_combo_of_CG06-09_8_20_14_all_37_19]PIR08082.1 MAG: hypothetical protein COV53_04900 [Candidatus Gottesmanbacteria bacterium CG11_big_fil_rev_8_21_14_0_20_37_11]PIZ03319.1 MAG: hypothetical protein COY59_00160 [Candidatus Gottesmanbacteria bacterium CG_4_10_14_0_8_um_filter_37_24]
MKALLILFYILLFLLPTQLGRHFFFDFSYVSGLRSDYLAPVLYVTDLLIFSILFTFFFIKHKKNIRKKQTPLVIVYSLYLLFSIIFVPLNKWAAIYKFIKLTEFFLLGYVTVKIKPKIFHVISVLSIGSFYSSVVAIWQFIIQKSIGGYLWFMGERTFNSLTPGIALGSWGGRSFLRPYATFPHPNVLGGFLSLVLTYVIYTLTNHYKVMKKTWLLFYMLVTILGVITLVITFSRLAWASFLVGVFCLLILRKKDAYKWLQSKKTFLLIILYLIILSSVVILIFISLNEKSIIERKELIQVALSMIASKPLFGVGLNNFIVQVKFYVPYIKNTYLLQPVHNVYLLIFSELGFVGFFLTLLGISVLLLRSLKSRQIVFISIVQLFFLGMFDHYLFTLQQGMLLFTVIASLAFLPEKN